MTTFAPPSKRPYPLTAMIFGPTGSGKTYGALTLARGLTGPSGRIALVSTEAKGANFQIALHQFDERILPREHGFSAEVLMDMVQASVNEGYDAVIIDSVSDFWEGPGGMLEVKDKLDSANYKLQFSNWRVISRLCDQINELVVYRAGIHVIYTAFAKDKLKMIEGQKEPVHLGIMPRVRENLYERLDVVIELLDSAHNAVFVKNRIGAPEFDGPITVAKAAALRTYMLAPEAKQAKAAAANSETLTVNIAKGKANEKLMSWIGYGDNEILIFPNLAAPPCDIPATLTVEARRRTAEPISASVGGRNLPAYDVLRVVTPTEEKNADGPDD